MCARVLCPDDGRRPQSFHVPRAAVFTCLAHFPLRIRSKTFLNSDRASFFCWCGVFCVACGACGTLRQCSTERKRSIKTLAAGTCLQ